MAVLDESGLATLWGLIKAGFAKLKHASQHATGGSDPIKPSDIGAVEVVDPVIQGELSVTYGDGYSAYVDTDSGDARFSVGNDIDGITRSIIITDARVTQNPANALLLYDYSTGDAYDIIHSGNKNSITPADIGAIALNGSTGNLTYAHVEGNGYGSIYKNHSATADYGFNIVDTDASGNTAVITPLAKSQRVEIKLNNTIYTALHTGNKSLITPADIGAAPGGAGVGERAVDISNKNLTTYLAAGKSGFYRGANITNAPVVSSGSDGWWYFTIIAGGGTTFATVIAQALYDPANVQFATYTNSTLSAWKKMTTTGHTHTSLVSRGNVTAETGTTVPAVAGLSLSKVYNNGYPTTYGNVITLGGSGHGELLIGWSGTSGAHAPNYIRSKRDTTDASWSDWAQIYTSAHKPTPADIGALPTTGGAISGTVIQQNLTLYDGVNNVTAITAYDDGDSYNYGAELVIGANGNSFIGSGESPKSLRTTLQSGTMVTNEAYGRTGENMYISSDANIFLETNCNTIASRKCVKIGTGGDITAPGTITGSSVVGAVYNDYAEYRATTTDIHPGRVVVENGDDTLSLSSERLQPGANVVSDTFGFSIGQTDICNTPIAVSGRVLAYPYEDRDSYEPGDAVCAAPNGTVSKMTREEIMTYPERIIGTVSSIPSYEKWGSNEVLVDGRIWIRIR